MKDYTNPYQTPSAQPSPGADSTAALAGRWQRLAGAIIDGLVGMIIIGPLFYFTGTWASLMQGDAMGLTTTLTWFIVGELVFLALQGYLLFNRQQTIGKWLLNMKIVGVEQDAVPAGKLYGVRYLFMHVLAQVPILNLIMIIDPLLIFRKDKRCLHDLLAGTRVIEAPQS